MNTFVRLKRQTQNNNRNKNTKKERKEIIQLKYKHDYHKTSRVHSRKQRLNTGGNVTNVFRTRCSAIAERPCCGERYSFGQKWKTEAGRQYFTDTMAYLQPLWYIRPENLSNSAKTTHTRAITAFNVIQGHQGRYQSKARMRLHISD